MGNKLQVWLGFFELNSVIDQKRYQEGILEKGFNLLSKLSFVHYFYSIRNLICLFLTELHLYYHCIMTRVSNTFQFKVSIIKVYNVHYKHNKKDDLKF